MLIGPCASRALNCAILSASASCAAVSLWCICSSLTMFFRAFHSPCLASLLAAEPHQAKHSMHSWPVDEKITRGYPASCDMVIFD